MLEPPTVAGPGFINLRLKSDLLANAVQRIATDPKLGVEPAATAEDVRHRLQFARTSPSRCTSATCAARSSATRSPASCASSATRSSPTTTSATGARSSACCSTATSNFLDEAAFEADPVRELARLYVDVRNLFKKADDEDEEGWPTTRSQNACRQETAKLHAATRRTSRCGSSSCRTAWPRSQRDLPTGSASCRSTTQHGESFYNPMLPGVVEDLLAKGIAFESQGAIVIPNATGIIPRRRGAEEGRAAGDRPQARRRVHLHDHRPGDDPVSRRARGTPDAMLYVVDFRQALHFKTLFAQARRWGYDEVELQHISFGSVLGEDGKPIKTRKGGAAELMHAARRGRRSWRCRSTRRATRSARRTGTRCRS